MKLFEVVYGYGDGSGALGLDNGVLSTFLRPETLDLVVGATYIFEGYQGRIYRGVATEVRDLGLWPEQYPNCTERMRLVIPRVERAWGGDLGSFFIEKV